MTCDLMRHVRRDAASGCWLWTSWTHHRDGYAMVRCDGRVQMAHRVSYALHVGPIPDGMVIDHRCRNRACVNPEHLEPVTVAENNRRGRQTRLDVERVREIRRLHAHGAAIREMARLYGVGPSAIRDIVRGETWVDV